MRLTQLMMSKSAHIIYNKYPSELAMMVSINESNYISYFILPTFVGFEMLAFYLLETKLFTFFFIILQVVTISKQFALLHTVLKFEALHLLSAILSSTNSVCKF